MEIPIGDVYKIENKKNGQFVDLQIGQMLTEHLSDMSRANTASVRFFNYVYDITREQKKYHLTNIERIRLFEIYSKK